MIALTSKEDSRIPENGLIFFNLAKEDKIAGFIAVHKNQIYSNQIRMDFGFADGEDILENPNVKEVVNIFIKNIEATLQKAQSQG